MKSSIIIGILCALGMSIAQAQNTINVKFVNNSDTALTFAPITESTCVNWPSSITVDAKSSKTFFGTLTCMQYQFSTNFTLQIDAKPMPSVNLSCSTDIGGCSTGANNFPVKLNDQTIKFTDGNTVNPWTYIFDPVK